MSWRNWITWPWRMLAFLAWYAKELFTASLVVLHDNLTPGQQSTPGIARITTRCRTDGELTLLAALITITPGTLTLGTGHTDEAGVLYVHGMYAADPDGLRQSIADMEARMLHACRREGAPA